MRIKLNPLDRLFSQYIGLRDGGICQRCGGKGNQTSHFWGRARKSTRYDESNAVLLCFGCHQYFHSHPQEHSDWFRSHLGEKEFNLLQGRMRIPARYIDEKLLTIYFKEKIKNLNNL